MASTTQGNDQPSLDDLISLKEAADNSGLSPNHLRLLVGRGDLWGKKIGRNWVTTIKAVNEYLARDRKPGPKPKSNLLKVLEGNPGKRPLRNNLRIKLLKRIQTPRWLPKYGKQFWRIHTPLLKSYGLLTELDSVAFEMLCVNYAVFRETAEILQKEGLLTKQKKKIGNSSFSVLLTNQKKKNFQFSFKNILYFLN